MAGVHLYVCVCLCARVNVCVCEEHVARLDQMQASGGTAAIAPMPAFFTASLHPDSMCLFVCVRVRVYVYLDVGACVTLSDLG